MSFEPLSPAISKLVAKDAVVAEVILPFASTVITGIALELP